jgi:DNA-binding LacI/PurR family transcriptional regulator/DNA-binding transcriptional regulator YhcF (GntR family)
VQYVVAAITGCRERGEHWLPGVRALCAECGCSQTTMVKALARMVSEGRLATGRRIFILPEPNASGQAPLPDAVAPAVMRRYDQPYARWQELARTLEANLTARRFEPGAPLQSVKQLCARYATSFKPMKAALNALCAQGLIIRDRRGYRTCAVARPSSGGTIVFIAMTGSLAHLVDYTPRSSEFWRRFERECVERRINLVIRSCDEAIRDLSGPRGRHAGTAGSPVLGHVLWIQGFDGHRMQQLSPLLARARVPTAIMDEGANGPLEVFTGGNPQCRVFSILADGSAGLAVGRHLQTLGHRHIACFCPYPMRNDRFYRLHAEGFDTVFRASLGMSVTYVCPPQLADDSELVRALESRDSASEFDKVLGRTTAHLRALFNTDDLFFLYSYARWESATVMLQTLMEPLFEQTLAGGKCTAWVGANDGLALLALNFLRRHGVAVPRDVSVAGFDNTIHSFVRGMTSYDFNMPAMVTALLDHVLMPRRARMKAALPQLLIPGSVVVRASSGEAPRNQST